MPPHRCHHPQRHCGAKVGRQRGPEGEADLPDLHAQEGHGVPGWLEVPRRRMGIRQQSPLGKCFAGLHCNRGFFFGWQTFGYYQTFVETYQVFESFEDEAA